MWCFSCGSLSCVSVRLLWFCLWYPCGIYLHRIICPFGFPFVSCYTWEWLLHFPVSLMNRLCCFQTLCSLYFRRIPFSRLFDGFVTFTFAPFGGMRNSIVSIPDRCLFNFFPVLHFFFFQKAVLLCLLAVIIAYSVMDGNPLYAFDCMKQCSAIFSNCYKSCNVLCYEMGYVKRESACSDTCKVTLESFNHYCVK